MTSPISSPRECKLLLAVDTSGPEGSLALAEFEAFEIKKMHQVAWVKKSAHSEVITLELQRLFTDAGFELKDLTHIAVNVGPGSFTGLRIGISLAKTLAYALKLEIMPVNALELLAMLAPGLGDKFIATKAIQKFFYCARFLQTDEDLQILEAPHARSAENLPGGSKVWIETVSPDFTFTTKAEQLACFVAKFARKRTFLEWKSVEPLYVRGSEAEEKLKAGLLKPV